MMEMDEGESDKNDCSFEGCIETPASPVWGSPSFSVTARKLDFSSIPPLVFEIPPSPQKIIPPYQHLRYLRLTENPSTPSTIFQNSGRRILPVKCEGRLSAPNLNPFTPEGMRVTSRKRSRTHYSSDSQTGVDANSNFEKSLTILNNNNNKSCESNDGNENEKEEESGERPPKRLAIIESNTGLSRFLSEFEEKRLIGTGNFGSVFLCTNRMDGCNYAIKKSNKPIAGGANEKRALIEVFAHAVLGHHENVVRYFSAWAEDKFMLIQNEYCNGGSLHDVIENNRASGSRLSEPELCQLISHVAEGLRFIHSRNLVHMDIKPANIFISRDTTQVQCDNQDNNAAEDEESNITYKIGDLGHVTSIAEVPDDVDEGDSRYLSKELLSDKYDNLPKADIFAFGLTIYEAAGGGPLPKNGRQWVEYREGKLPELSNLSNSMNTLIKNMTSPDPDDRPTALQVLAHPGICYTSNKTKEQLERELIAEKTKTQILQKRLKEMSWLFQSKVIPRNLTDGVRTRNSKNSRILGKNVNRSHSTTEFGW